VTKIASKILRGSAVHKTRQAGYYKPSFCKFPTVYDCQKLQKLVDVKVTSDGKVDPFQDTVHVIKNAVKLF